MSVWDPRAELESLRRRPNTAHVNCLGEHMWLKQIDRGLTDCCFIDEPCETHAGMPRPLCAVEGCLHDEDSATKAHFASGLYLR